MWRKRAKGTVFRRPSAPPSDTDVDIGQMLEREIALLFKGPGTKGNRISGLASSQGCCSFGYVLD